MRYEKCEIEIGNRRNRKYQIGDQKYEIWEMWDMRNRKYEK